MNELDYFDFLPFFLPFDLGCGNPGFMLFLNSIGIGSSALNKFGWSNLKDNWSANLTFLS